VVSQSVVCRLLKGVHFLFEAPVMFPDCWRICDDWHSPFSLCLVKGM